MGGIKPELVFKAYQDLLKTSPEDIKVDENKKDKDKENERFERFKEFMERLGTPELKRSYNSQTLQINRYATAGKHGKEIYLLANEFLKEGRIPKSCKKILKRLGKKNWLK